MKCTNSEKYDLTGLYYFGGREMGVSDAYELNEDTNYPDTISPESLFWSLLSNESATKNWVEISTG